MKRKRPTDDMFKKALDQSIPTTKDKLRFGVDETQSILAELPIESIIVDKQVRSHFDEAEIESLAKSIEQVGLQQPVKVSLVDPVFKKYKLIVGERRLRAFIYLGKSTIPAFIGKDDAQNKYIVQLYENIHRKDLHPIEKASGIVDYMARELELRKIKIDLDLHTFIRNVINKKAFKKMLNEKEEIFAEILHELKIPYGTLKRWFVTSVFSKEAQEYFIKTDTSLRIIEKLSSKAYLPLPELIQAIKQESKETSNNKVSVSFVSSGFKVVCKKLNDISRTVLQTNMIKHNPKSKADILASADEVIKLAQEIKNSLN